MEFWFHYHELGGKHQPNLKFTPKSLVQDRKKKKDKSGRKLKVLCFDVPT